MAQGPALTQPVCPCPLPHSSLSRACLHWVHAVRALSGGRRVHSQRRPVLNVLRHRKERVSHWLARNGQHSAKCYVQKLLRSAWGEGVKHETSGFRQSRDPAGTPPAALEQSDPAQAPASAPCSSARVGPKTARLRWMGTNLPLGCCYNVASQLTCSSKADSCADSRCTCAQRRLSRSACCPICATACSAAPAAASAAPEASSAAAIALAVAEAAP